MQKNTSGQKLIVYCFDSTTSTPKTGDAANLTAYVSIDFGGVTVLADTSASEMDSTNAKGYYLFDLAQAETNGDTLLFSAKSVTANIVVLAVPATVYTVPASFTSLNVANVNTLSGHDPGATLASQTNITGGTITTVTTVTNLTNAPTAGDFTAAMKASLNSATPVATLANGAIVTATFGACDFTATMKASLNAATPVATLSSAYDFAKGSVAMTESYAADGSPPTPSQAFFMIWSILAERSFVGLTLNAKKIDGATIAMTFGLDAQSPTSQTRTS